MIERQRTCAEGDRGDCKRRPWQMEIRPALRDDELYDARHDQKPERAEAGRQANDQQHTANATRRSGGATARPTRLSRSAISSMACSTLVTFTSALTAVMTASPIFVIFLPWRRCNPPGPRPA